jgi:ppGpp synthetase/RelA/SpoT-type nucleotidyltranferase
MGRTPGGLGRNGPSLKIVKLGLEKRIINFMKQGKSVKAMADKLNKEGVEITPQSISKFIVQSKQEQANVIKSDVAVSTEFKKMYLDYNKALKDILTEVEEVKTEARNEKDYKTYSALVGRLLQGIELFSKIAGDLKVSGTGDINIIYNEISRNVEKEQRKTIDQIFKDDVIDVDAIILEQKEESKRRDENEQN